MSTFVAHIEEHTMTVEQLDAGMALRMVDGLLHVVPVQH